MDLSDLKGVPGARRRRKRIGRGIASGHGKTAGRGHKGKGSRSGGNTPPGYEGGQMPLQRRLPKRGFRRLVRNEARRKCIAIVNLSTLAKLGEVSEVTPTTLVEAGLVAVGRRIKVLGDGEIKRAIKVNAHAFSRAAQEKIAAAGGNAVLIEAD